MREVRQCSIVYFGVPDCKTTRRSSMIEILLYLIGILSFPVLSTRVESMNASSDVILLSIWLIGNPIHTRCTMGVKCVLHLGCTTPTFCTMILRTRH